MSGKSPEYLVLVRHAQGATSGAGPASKRYGSLSSQGLQEAMAVASRLAQTLHEDQGVKRPEDVAVLHPPSGAAEATAAVIAEALDAALQSGGTADASVPRWPVAELVAGKLETKAGALTEIAERAGADVPKVLVAVGHDPDLGRQLHAELREGAGRFRTRLASRIPLRRSEAAMLDCRNTRRSLTWVISPESTELIAELQDKVKSKMDTAKVFGAFLTAVTAVSVNQLVGPPRSAAFVVLGGIGVAFLAFAVVAYLITMFLYDSLLMPTTQWPSAKKSDGDQDSRSLTAEWSTYMGTGQNPIRPPSSAATVIFHSMQRVWGGLFVPATCSAGVGITLIALALAEPTGRWWGGVLVAVVAIPAAAFALAGAARPRFGSND